MTKQRITAAQVGREHVGKYMRLSLGWPADEGTRETIVTAMVTEIRYTTEYAPERPIGVVVFLDLGVTVAEFLLPDSEDVSITVGETMDDLHPAAEEDGVDND